ncbi:hypothetical protein APHAL10511_008130 [Amanita phalloides]|nr:hypothetical protein APHAL10511_008130 [Amanita phalloides]
MISPDPDLQFRIQSAVFLTCLELSAVSDLYVTEVGLRPPSDTDYQLWRFEEAGSSYHVRNVANSNQFLLEHASAVFASDTYTDHRAVQVSYRDGAYHLAFHTRDGHYEFYAADGSRGKVRVEDFGERDVEWEERKWHLVPQTSPSMIRDPPLAGSYRIRSHDGKNLLTMPEKSTGATNVYVRSQFDQSDYQRWIVTLKSDRQCIIQNDGSKLYLGCSAASPAVGDGLVGLEEEYLWHIPSIGGSAWSLRIPASEFSIGIADYEIHDRDEVCLVPIDNAYSQLCIPTADRQRPPYLHERLPPWRIVPGFLTTSKFELKYINKDSGRFKLTVADTNPAQEVTVIEDREDHIGLTGKGTEFALLEGDPGHVIFLPDSGHPLRVVSGRTTTDNNGNPVFSVDKKVAEDLIQMWILVPTK